MEIQSRESRLYQECTPITCIQAQKVSERLGLMSSDARLQENKNRREIIEKIRQREREEILKKRKEKEENIQKLLSEKNEAKKNAKILFDNYRKTCSNKFEMQNSPIKSELIDDKIEDCRMRATEYTNNRKNKLKKMQEKNELRVKGKLDEMEAIELQKINACHLSEWKEYEKKLKVKHQGEKRSPRHLYDAFVEREKEIKKIINKYKKQGLYKSSNQTHESQDLSDKGSKKQIASNSLVNKTWEKNPILMSGHLSQFGLNKQIIFPEKMLIKMQNFLQKHKMTTDPQNQEVLLVKFEEFLSKDAKL